jgi:peptidoglycan hydrolase-like protein with peptidoglycan-binding domain
VWRWLAAAALALATLAVLGVVLAGSGSPKRAGADTGVPPGDTTTTVTRRTLSESSTVDGTLGYGSTLELYDRLAGIFTWLPAVGAVIVRGGTLFRVDNLPVALMYGSVPAYRTLKEGVGDGPDVTELNRNLIDLGFDRDGAITDDEHFDEATAAAVRRWQKAEGLTQTGDVELGRVIFAPGPRRVTDVHVTLGQDPPGGPSEEPAARHKHPKGKKPKDKSSPKKPTSEEKEKPSSSGESPGAAAGAGTLVLGTTSTQKIVRLKLKAEQQQLAHVGEPAPVTLPGGEVVHGRITDVGTVASASTEGEKPSGEKEPSGEAESATIPVTLALDHRVARLDQAPVSVELVKSIRHDVLTVPATALIATAGGGYAVEALAGVRRVVLAVTPGMFAGGYVQVEGAGLHEGLIVIEAQ